jgi:hypothetical protein
MLGVDVSVGAPSVLEIAFVEGAALMLAGEEEGDTLLHPNRVERTNTVIRMIIGIRFMTIILSYVINLLH